MDLIFTVNAAVLPRLEEWMRTVDLKYAEQQVAASNAQDDHLGSVLRKVKESIGSGEPTPYYGAIGGAYEYIFVPTSLGYLVKVRHAVTGDTIDLTDYSDW